MKLPNPEASMSSISRNLQEAREAAELNAGLFKQHHSEMLSLLKDAYQIGFVDGLRHEQARAKPEVPHKDEKTASVIAGQMYGALRYMLDQIQLNPDLMYYLRHTEAHRRMIAAEAAYVGRPFKELESERQQDRQPLYAWRKADPEVFIERLQNARLPTRNEPRDVRTDAEKR